MLWNTGYYYICYILTLYSPFAKLLHSIWWAIQYIFHSSDCCTLLYMSCRAIQYFIQYILQTTPPHMLCYMLHYIVHSIPQTAVLYMLCYTVHYAFHSPNHCTPYAALYIILFNPSLRLLNSLKSIVYTTKNFF